MTTFVSYSHALVITTFLRWAVHVVVDADTNLCITLKILGTTTTKKMKVNKLKTKGYKLFLLRLDQHPVLNSRNLFPKQRYQFFVKTSRSDSFLVNTHETKREDMGRVMIVSRSAYEEQ